MRPATAPAHVMNGRNSRKVSSPYIPPLAGASADTARRASIRSSVAFSSSAASTPTTARNEGFGDHINTLVNADGEERAPGVIPIVLKEPDTKKRMRKFLSSLASCRTVLRRAWSSDVDRTKEERSFLLYESERLKDVVEKAQSKDPELLTCSFWKLADNAVDQASLIVSQSLLTSFEGMKTIVPAELSTELGNIRPLSRYQSCEVTQVANLPVVAEAPHFKATCTCAHPGVPNRAYFACSSGEVFAVSLNDTAVYTKLDFGHVYPVTHILCSPVRERGPKRTPEVFLITASLDKTVRVMSLAKNRIHRVFINGHAGVVSAMCVWGGQLITAGMEGKVLVWDLSLTTHQNLFKRNADSGERRRSKSVLENGPVRCLVAAGQLLNVGYASGAVDVFVSTNAQVLGCTFDAPPTRLCFRLKHAAALRRDLPLSSMDVSSGAWSKTHKTEPPSPEGHRGAVTCMALKDDMSTLFTGGEDTLLIKWVLQRREQAWKVKAHSSTLTGITVVNQGLVVTSSEDGLIKLWDEAKAVEVCVVNYHEKSVLTLALLAVPAGDEGRGGRGATERATSPRSKRRPQADTFPKIVTAAGDPFVSVWMVSLPL